MRYVFGDVMLDTQLYVLHRDGRPRPLRVKVFQVLHYLLLHRDRVISKQELCEQVWPNQFVSEAALEGVIKAVRQAVGDDGRTQWCIQTRRSQGYRFVASVTIPAPPSGVSAQLLPASPPLAGLMVGREVELTDIHQWWRQAHQGIRQMGFVVGEAGIGKTTLVDAFVAHVSAEADAWVGHGQCIEQYGAGEAYLPLLEALGRLCREPDGASLLALLRQHAPSWLVQMPTLLPPAEYAALQRLVHGVTQARMLRELAEAVETLTAARPLILVLEDLHWSDVSTLAWLAYVARRRDSARLFVLGTYRPVETLRRSHPLRTIMPELQRQQACHVLELTYLSPTAVAAYLVQRFGGKPLPQDLCGIIHQRTDGNPLFMVSLVDEMVQQGVLDENPHDWEIVGGGKAEVVGVPENLRHLIEQRLERLEPDDQRLLEAASMTGVECSAAAIATATNRDIGEVEERCAIFARCWSGRCRETPGRCRRTIANRGQDDMDCTSSR